MKTQGECTDEKFKNQIPNPILENPNDVQARAACAKRYPRPDKHHDQLRLTRNALEHQERLRVGYRQQHL